MASADSNYSTRPSLLLRLREDSSDADWERFYDLYAGLIHHYARQRGCSETMAHDVLQETLLTLSWKLTTFHYDPAKGRFRSWLLRIVHGKIVDAFRREARHAPIALDEDEVTATDRFEEMWDAEWRDHLLQLALAELRRTTTTTAYESFRLSTLEGRPVEDVCTQLQLDRNTVYQHRHRATRKLTDLIADLSHELGDPL